MALMYCRNKVLIMLNHKTKCTGQLFEETTEVSNK